MPTTPTPLSRLVVGSIADFSTLSQIIEVSTAPFCDLVEIRMDGLASQGPVKRDAWAPLVGRIPLLFTARCVEEGGMCRLDTESRRALLELALPDAAWIDIEVASLPELKPLIQSAHHQGVRVIASAHDFASTPDRDTLTTTINRGRDAGADVAKWATRLHSLDDMKRLLTLLEDEQDIPLSLMGMGPLAPVSRVLAAQLGSVLNYGFLGTNATAPGQWSAARLREAIHAVEWL